MRGQITVFIIIGIVLVVMIGGLLLITNREDVPIVSGGLDTQVVQYVTSCLQTALEDGLLRLGRQGFQLNLLPTDCRSILCPAHQQPADAHMYNLSAVFIPYVIRIADQNGGGSFHSEVSAAKYPWEDFPKSSAGLATHPFLSIVSLPPLYSQGTNASVQEQLERHIESLLVQCATFEPFKNMQIKTGKPSAELMFSADRSAKLDDVDEDVRVQVNWTVIIKTLGATSTLSEWTARAPVRLGRIYHHVEKTLFEDATNATFDLAEAKGFSVEKHWSGQGDRIKFKDVLSTLNGKPYEVQFLRQNRRPILYPLSSSGNKDSSTRVCTPAVMTAIAANNSYYLQIKALGNKQNCAQQVRVPNVGVLKTVDPDEDDVTICVIVNGKPPQRVETVQEDVFGATDITIYACDGGGCPVNPSWFGPQYLCSHRSTRV